MHQTATTANPPGAQTQPPPGMFGEVELGGPEMHLYTRYEHGNLPVRVFRDDDGRTRYEVTHPGGRAQEHASARQLISSLYGHDVHMPFDRYFRLGRYRRSGRASGGADLLTLLDSRTGGSRKTSVVVHGREVREPRRTGVGLDRSDEGEKSTPDPAVAEFLAAVEEDLRPLHVVEEPKIEVSEEMIREFDRAFSLELDRLEGRVGIDLGERSTRSGSVYKADEVRRLLWRGFAGKMLSQGYDPDDVLQEVYRGLLVRNRGKCPWDAQKSSFGHYVHMVISCVLTNYHRKDVRRIDRDALPLVAPTRDGEEMEMAWGAVEIHEGHEVGDMLALEQLATYLAGLPDDAPEAELGRRILPLVASGHQRGEIVREIGARPSLVSRALAWLRRQTALWATESGMGRNVPGKYLLAT